MPNSFGEILFEKPETLQRVYGLTIVFAIQQFGSFRWQLLFCHCLQRAE